MPKRSKSDTLTGGTKDVNPQVYKLRVAIGTFTAPASLTAFWSNTQAFPVPIVKLPQTEGTAIVMEILKVRWINNIGFNSAQTNASWIATLVGYLTTKAPQAVGNGVIAWPNQADPSIISQVSISNAYATNAGGSITLFSVDNETPNVEDLTDDDGHGILVATDNVWVTLQATISSTTATADSTLSASNVEADLFYRFKKVALQEYIGIVQSQQ